MARVYSSPGVYIEEKSAFPNSVVAVSTAVPAFVGYTEKALYNKKDVLHEPVRISSFGEFLLHFGAAPKTTFDIRPVSGDAGFELEKPADESHYLLFHSIKLFYANGGADCYIVSVGNYQRPIRIDDFFGFTDEERPRGVNALEKCPEPTMLVIPDAVRLAPEECGNLQKQMLRHCGDIMRNRIAILDVPNGDQARTHSPDTDVITLFRERIGNQFLGFAAAYYPWLDTIITSKAEISFENIHPDQLPNLISILKADTQKRVSDQSLKKGKAEEINQLVDNITGFDPFLRLERLQRLLQSIPPSDIKRLSAAPEPEKKVRDHLLEVKASADKLLSAIDPKLPSGSATDRTADSNSSTEPEQKLAGDYAVFKSAWNTFGARIESNTKPDLFNDFETVVSKLNHVLENKPTTGAFHQTLLAVHPLYKEVVGRIAEKVNLLPPAAAMAGIYTMIDNNVGVFQSPANVSLGSVIKPCVNISANEQDDLNMPLDGKSVNAIRSFPGKGVLIWGARSMDGNRQDWRYISLRRTAILIEQSVKQVAEAFVFEPNTAATWSNLKAMITNFLTNMWSSGALAGARAEDAFRVDIGLGVTMTPVDILDGIMRISIKLALTRPAEYIVITFEQQMQKS
jgi:hypothetical protein